MCNTHNLALAIDTPASPTPVEAFGGELMAMLNGAAAALMISIGHRTGLFDTMGRGEAFDSETLAAAAGLDERYVREWLGAMATARIVELDGGGRYRLPQAHAALLGRDASAGNMANVFQFIAVLGQVETKIVDCFRNGGGVPYSAFERFHEIMAEESDQTVVQGLMPHIVPLVPGLVDRLEAGIEVADIGCGSGRAMNFLAALFPNSRFTGYDLSSEAIIRAEQEAAAKGLANARFHTTDATAPLDGGFDLVFSFDAIHDQAHPDTVLANIRAALNPGGVYICQEIDAQTGVEANLDHPMGAFLYTISCMHCMTVSLAQGGKGLGAAWGEQLAHAHLTDAGFALIEAHRLPHDIQNLYFVARP